MIDEFIEVLIGLCEQCSFFNKGKEFCFIIM